jgi:hypothetical protein
MFKYLDLPHPLDALGKLLLIHELKLNVPSLSFLAMYMQSFHHVVWQMNC